MTRLLRPVPRGAELRRTALRDVLLPAAGVLLLGPLAGLAWWLLAPTGPVVVGPDYLLPVATGSTGPPSDVYPAAHDAAFAAVAIVAGAVCGAVACVRPPPGRAVLVRWVSVLTAGFVAPVLGWSLGMLLGPASLAAQQATGVEPLVSPLRLSSPAPLLVWPAATCIVAFVVSLVSLLVRPPGDG